MRLLRLDLERYGAFTSRSLVFRPDARLHVVLGPNEAGKSTALAAVTDLLFGIAPRTAFAFLHEMPELRLGAQIESRDGRQLAFRRRKGNRNTLVDAQDSPLADDALAPFLQGLTRDVFCRAFGLDAQGLREGGREMLDAEGELGASLFAAGSGLRGYTALQESLETEAQGIFAPRKAKDRSFYQALDRYEEARKDIRASELREGRWRELNEAIAAAATRLDAVKASRERLATERARCERLKRVAPLVAAVDAATASAEADAGLAQASDIAVDRLGETLSALRAAATEQARVETDLAALKAEVASLPEPSGLLAQAEDIHDGFRGIDRFDKDGADLPRIRGDLARLSDELDRLAVRVGLPNGPALAERQPSDAARARVEVLAREGRDGVAEIVRIERELATARADHERLSREEADAGAPIDPAPLRERLKSFAWLRLALQERDGIAAAIAKTANVLRGKAARLSPSVSDTAALAERPLPSGTAITRHREVLEENERALALARKEREAAAKAVAVTRERIRRREGGRPVASRAELNALRAERDAGFAPLREALASGARTDPARVATYERLLHAADRQADDLADDATRVAEQAADRAQLAEQETHVTATVAVLDALDAARAAAQKAWADLWRDSGIAPTSPAEMAGWLSSVETLIEEQGDLETSRIDVATRSDRIATALGPLAELGRQAGLSGVDGLEAGLLLAQVEERIAALGRHWEETRAASARIGAVAATIARQEAAFEAAKTRRSEWLTAWEAALPALGLAGAARIEEAEGALAAWREVPAALRERDTAERRVQGMERDRSEYHARIARLAEPVPDLDPASPSAAMRALHARLQTAQADATRRSALEKRLAEAERSAGGAHRALDDAQAALANLLAQIAPDLGSLDAGAAEALHARFCARRALRAECASRQAELARASDGIAEPDLRAALTATNPDAIEARLAQLAAEQDENEERGRIAHSERDRLAQQRSELEKGTGAELAHARKKSAEAEIAAEARQWAVLRIAGLMLSSAIARHRAGQQDPLLTRAGALFAQLTGGSFAGLAQDYGEADEARIVGRRPSGDRVPVEGLSEGSRDQLYLALRLAHLEDHAGRAEPAPFVGDDLFASFDDARTAHGLDALAAIGASVQPILFTHHAHVAEIARGRLGEAVDVVAL